MINYDEAKQCLACFRKVRYIDGRWVARDGTAACPVRPGLGHQVTR